MNCLTLSLLMEKNLLQVRYYRTSKKAHLNLTSQLDEIIVGTMLGDLSAEKPGLNSNTRLQFKQSLKNTKNISSAAVHSLGSPRQKSFAFIIMCLKKNNYLDNLVTIIACNILKIFVSTWP